jgi:hypothetical protein
MEQTGAPSAEICLSAWKQNDHKRQTRSNDCKILLNLVDMRVTYVRLTREKPDFRLIPPKLQKSMILGYS